LFCGLPGGQWQIVTCDPLSAEAGLEILRKGGNAIDAAVAAAAVLDVTSQNDTGIGGDLFAIVWSARDKKLYALNAAGWAPAGWSPRFFEEQLKVKSIPGSGVNSVTVPGAVAGFDALLKRFGTRSFKETLDRAAKLAEEGWGQAERRHADLRGGNGMFERFSEHAAVERADLGAATVGNVDLFEGGERAECLAHHRATDSQLFGEIGFAGQRVADAQFLGADMVADRVDRGADKGLARKGHEVGHAATPLDRSSLGDWPKRRPKARLKLALFE
jgi:hypothetical protein